MPDDLHPKSDRDRPDRILIVDDIPDNLVLVQTLLEDEGYRVELADGGEAALAATDASPPDLLLLDVMMPVVDGYEVTRRIRQCDRLPYIPILLITAHDASNVVAGLDAGADDFIRKPVEIDELLARVRSLLRLKHSIEDRERMARQQRDFVSRLTHDLRTPLVAADRVLNLTLGGTFGELPDSARESLTVMARSNRNLLAMVETLLEVHRHEAGAKVLTFAPFDLRTMVGEVAEELRPLAVDRGLEMQLDLGDPERFDARIEGDRLELRRVLANLIGNAIKFTDEGAIAVSLGRSATGLTIAVSDTGLGLSEIDRETLFDRFRQGDHKRSGSGLGLHLSKRIVEAHGGRIEVRSRFGEGSTFEIHLPVARSQ